MNIERPLFGRITINDSKIDLGKAKIMEMQRRIVDQYVKSKYTGNDVRIVIEMSYEKLPAQSIMSREQQLEAEFQALHIANPHEEEAFEEGSGITMARALVAYESESGQAYDHVCTPAKRIGVDDSYIKQLRDTYSAEFPDVCKYWPLWRTE